jgi:hypothetical protein
MTKQATLNVLSREAGEAGAPKARLPFSRKGKRRVAP